MKKNNKGFTLIELLSTVVILGILSVTAVLAVNRIIENVRKNNFVETAKSYANSARQLWVSDDIFCGNDNLSSSDIQDGDYYMLIDTSNEDFKYLLEEGGKSSWGNRDVKGYVRVNVSGSDIGKRIVKYYVAITDGIHGTTDEIEASDLVKGNLNMSMDKDKNKLKAISELPFTLGKVTTCGEYGSGRSIQYPSAEMASGNISSPKIGDTFSIGSEKFHVISSDDETVTGLAYYNLFVGGYYKNNRYHRYGGETTGIQDVRMTGWIDDSKSSQGSVPFKPTGDITSYLNNYKNYLESFNVKVDEIRLITKDELTNPDTFACEPNGGCSDRYPWIYTTTFWTQTPGDETHTWNVHKTRFFFAMTSDYKIHAGVRPVIKVNKSILG